jgi:excisionase family DNA binding protein
MTDDQRKQQPPLSTRECAEYLGVHTSYIVRAIRRGALKAEAIRPAGFKRTLYRIHEDDYIAWLQAIGCQRVPRRSSDAA